MMNVDTHSVIDKSLGGFQASCHINRSCLPNVDGTLTVFHHKFAVFQADLLTVDEDDVPR